MKTLYITEDREKELQLVETPKGLQIAITWRGYPDTRVYYNLDDSERAGLAAALLDASTDDES